jgi:hypothetical protein
LYKLCTAELAQSIVVFCPLSHFYTHIPFVQMFLQSLCAIYYTDNANPDSFDCFV